MNSRKSTHANQTPQAAINTPLRRPCVLAIAPAGQSEPLATALRRAPLSLRIAENAEDGRKILRRSHVSIVFCDFQTARQVIDAPLRTQTADPPRFLLFEQESPDIAAALANRIWRSLPNPADARVVIASMLALAHGWEAARIVPEQIDANLSVVRDCGLVFCRDRVLPMLRLERQLFALLSKSPGQKVTWEALSQSTTATRKHLYVALGRMRSRLNAVTPDHEYIRTYLADGVAFLPQVRNNDIQKKSFYENDHQFVY